MKLTIVEKNLLSWTAMHIDFVMCKNTEAQPGFVVNAHAGELFSEKKNQNVHYQSLPRMEISGLKLLFLTENNETPNLRFFPNFNFENRPLQGNRSIS